MKRIVKLPEHLLSLGASLELDFETIKDTTQTIRQKLQKYANGKLLKGDEITGWLGEVYGKMILNGKLVPDDYAHDVEAGNKRVSVKARKGASGNWQTTGTISEIEGDMCPTHLMFIQFTESYLIIRVWLFPWKHLRDNGRFKKKTVRGGHQGYYVRIKPSIDKDYLIYSQER